MEADSFATLAADLRFEGTGKGRRGAVLVAPAAARGTPIVRTTTSYRAPPQSFGPAHARLAEQIQRFASLPVAFNHALVERYTNLYRTMGAHSDQALDLRGDAFIAIFSCYAHPERAHARKLVVGEKAADGGAFELPLLHHGVVIFSVGANRRFRHKIEVTDAAADNEWLGFTFRTSKTFVRHRGDAVLFDDDVRLTLADDEQRQEFLQLRRRENVETDFTYPRITYTLSESDLRPPSGPGHEASG